MVDKIEVKATYDSAKDVPFIGQKKVMRVNGRRQTVTLNGLLVNRHHEYEDNGYTRRFFFVSEEEWSGYYDSKGA